MRKPIVVTLSAYVLTVAGVAVLTPWTGSTRADAPKTPWKITGQLEEACSCNGACP